MKVFWNPDCLLHNPPYGIFSGKKVPYYESPARLQLIKKELEEHPSLFAVELASSSGSSESQDLKLDISRYVQMVHGHDYLRYLSNAYDNWVRSGGSTVPLPLLACDKLLNLQVTFFLRMVCYLIHFRIRGCSLSQVRLRLSHSLPRLKQVRRYRDGMLTLPSTF